MTGKGDVLLLDFNDSFTYNVASELLKIGIKTLVIPKPEIKKYLRKVIEKNKKTIIVYGPGPGHPDEYDEFFPLILKAIKRPYIYSMGICLGHQLLWRAQGYQVISSQTPIHGQQMEFEIPHWEEFDPFLWGKKVNVQRYNSLVVKGEGIKFSYHEGEVMAGRFERGVSFQFHPESVGTKDPTIFFKSIKNFLIEPN